MPQKKQVDQKLDLAVAFFGGSGIGLLFGVIMGSSITPTVATMLGILTTMLAGILGLNDKLFNNTKSVRIGSFGLACVIGAYIGIYVRSHNALAPSLQELKQQYLAAGFSEQQSLNFIAMKEFGVSLAQLDAGMTPPMIAAKSSSVFTSDVPESDSSPDADSNSDNASDSSPESITAENESEAETVSQGQTPHAQTSHVQTNAVAATAFKQHNSLLFGAKVEVSGCDELIYTDASLPLDEVLNNFELTGQQWETLVLDVTEAVPEEYQKAVLLTVKDAVCIVKEPEINDCRQAKEIIHNSAPEDVLSELTELNRQWENIVQEVVLSDLAAEQSVIALTKVEQLLCAAE